MRGRWELKISGIQAVRSKHKQNWTNHLEKNGQNQTSETRPRLQTSRGEEIVNAIAKDGNTSMPEQVKRPNSWMMMMMMIMIIIMMMTNTSDFMVSWR
jgi:hypothetical protein